MDGPGFYATVDAEQRLSRGDLAVVYLPQSRLRGETGPPLTTPHRRVETPAYVGSFRIGDATRMPTGEVEVWPALAVVVMDSCELDRAFNLGRSRPFWDSRVAVAPIIFETHYPHGPWRRMADGAAPLYAFPIEPLPPGVDGETNWPRGFVDLRGASLVSRSQVELNRRLRLSASTSDALAMRTLEFWYLREIARQPELEARRGKTIRGLVPVQLGADYAEVRLHFEDAEPLTVICRVPPVSPGA